MTPQETKQPDFKEADDLINKSLADMHKQNHVEYVARFRNSTHAKGQKWIDRLQRLLHIKPQNTNR